MLLHCPYRLYTARNGRVRSCATMRAELSCSHERPSHASHIPYGIRSTGRAQVPHPTRAEQAHVFPPQEG